MKKILFFVVLLGALFLCACGTDITGNWKVTKVNFNNQEQKYEDYIKSINTDGFKNTDITICVTTDNHYEINLMGDNSRGTWEKKDDKYFFDFNKNQVEATLEGTLLSLPLGNCIFIFEK